MALATQCPHCHTAFKVAYDQLKLRAGLVRCGTCKQVFNGIENLVRPDAMTAGLPLNPPSAFARPAQEPAVAIEQPADLPPLDLVASEELPPAIAPAAIVAPAPAPAAPAAMQKAADPLHYTSMADFTASQNSEPTPEPEIIAEEPAPAVTNPVDQPQSTLPPLSLPEPETIAEPAPTPALPVTAAADTAPAEKQAPTAAAALPDEETPPPESEHADFSLAEDETATQAQAAEIDAADEAEDEIAEPDFVLRSRRRQRIGRSLRLVMGIGVVLLFIGAALQGAYAFRNQLAAWLPQTKPMLAQLCEVAGCQVKLPAQIDMVTIESNELQALAADKNTFVLTLLLRNHSAVAQAWPNIELTLNDADETALARRVLLPRDYLPPGQDAVRGFAANSEQPLKLNFELTQLKASGYRVYLFYP